MPRNIKKERLRCAETFLFVKKVALKMRVV